jgi:hypothetical protein
MLANLAAFPLLGNLFLTIRNIMIIINLSNRQGRQEDERNVRNKSIHG